MDDLIAYFQNCLEMVSNLITPLGVVTVALNIRKFCNDVDAHRKQDEQILIQNSINVLRKFAEQIIPEVKSINQKMASKLQQRQRKVLVEINEEMAPERSISMQEFIKKPQWLSINDRLRNEIKDEYNLSNIFNELEQVSVYMNYNMVKQDLVFSPLHKFLLDFINDNLDYFNRLKENQVPYINLTRLYNNWQRFLMIKKNNNND
ncbi:hypothetical protein HMPREF0501_00921 [Limosilactobacillus coleohominis 101-4-CHN]|uniref:Uncharacterized protein n=1 Tax=Limosilactobacillus coleohominis 101-4-CHN TaxID=575594 RepID=C7XW27_9LACO|nr:hypothetical protein [Limosilactobacillus coleohominis]EEU30543.1 hypothetical protein HMPREF0501_00921 [Limosilactobacillus coleohominis 101-4-CHN]